MTTARPDRYIAAVSASSSKQCRSFMSSTSSYIRLFMSGRYRECLNYPVLILLVVILLSLVAGYFSREFSFDASEDTLVAESDPELAYYLQITESFGSQEFLFLTYGHRSRSVINSESLADIERLTRKLEEIGGVSAVTSILDAPLFRNPPVPIQELARGYKTLRSAATVDLELAEQELTESPLFRDLLISADGRTTALRIGLEDNLRLAELKSERDRLRRLVNPDRGEQAKLEQVEKDYRSEYARSLARRDATLDEIRTIRDSLGSEVVAYLGGVPLIASDMIEYVKNDITVFGIMVAILIGLMLYVIFRRLRWVLLPLISTAVTVLLTIGVLGYLRQPTTVISSNFISLLAIITISMAIHLIARYRELKAETTGLRHVELVIRTMTDKFAPCVYTALTTMVAFASLITSDIVPVMDFGWIMCIGILISFLVTYSLFAGMLLLLPRTGAGVTLYHEPVLTRFLGHLSTGHTALVLGAATVAIIIAGIGINKVSLDNRFIEYFREDSEIHRGLAYIDRYLGGTIPLDIILRFSPSINQAADADSDFFTEEEDVYPQRYWFTSDKFDYVAKMHRFLENKPEIGKVISIATLEQLGRTFNNGELLGPLELMGALGALPVDVRSELIDPYAAPDDGLLRVSARVHEIGPAFSHQQLIDDINAFISGEFGLPPENARITGMEVLFNGMLGHLFDSQKSTLIFVIVATFIMFALLLRSVTLAVLGLVPNILAAATILAVMGFAGIPMDIMTITIAAIIIGIGVDDAIHYLHRFQQEFADTQDVKTAVQNSHNSIGNALYYTSFTVVIGFSVLGFSNFIPTVYFGLLTSLAMILALLANLTVLPGLLVLVYGRDSRGKYRDDPSSS